MKLRFHSLMFPLNFPDDGNSGGGDDTLSRDLADLEDDPVPDNEESDTDTDDEPEGEDEPDPDAEPEPEPEDEEEPEAEPEEKEIPESGPDGRPTVKAIRSFGDGKYKDLFKDFPDLKTAYFSLPKYKELFPDIEEAEVAVRKANEYDQLEDSLVAKGDPEDLIKTLAENNPKALKKVFENFSKAARTHATDMYTALTTPIIEEVLYYASQFAEKNGNKNLALSAKHLANFVFNNGGEIPDISKHGKTTESPEAKELRETNENYARERYNAALDETSGAARNSLTSILSGKLDDLSDFERKALLRSAHEEVDAELKKDSALMKTLDRLWAQARKDNYSPASKARIKEAWLARAKQVGVVVRNRLRQEAVDARSGDGKNKNPQRKRNFPTSGGNNSGRPQSRVLDPKQIDYSKTSDMDILEGGDRIKLRK